MIFLFPYLIACEIIQATNSHFFRIKNEALGGALLEVIKELSGGKGQTRLLPGLSRAPRRSAPSRRDWASGRLQAGRPS